MTARGGTAPRTTPRLTGRAAVLGVLVLLLAGSLVVPLRQYLAQRGDISDLRSRVEYLQRERDRLAAHVDSLRDPEKLEQIARECLGMVRPGEIAFVPIPEDGQAPADDC